MSAVPVIVNVHEAKTHLSRYLADAEAGREVIARAGKPVAKLVRADAVIAPRQRRLGGLEGMGFRCDESAWTEQDQKELENSFYHGPLFPDAPCDP